MYLEYVEKLDKSSVLLPELFDELFALESEFERVSYKEKIKERAKMFGIAGLFESMYKAKEKDVKQLLKESAKKTSLKPSDNSTNFSMLQNNQLSCGEWIANDNGVSIRTDKGIAVASPHPIYITKILRNAETGQYKVELKFQIRGRIRTALVDRDVIASPQKIIKLANDSVQVTSNTANWLVQYLSDLESLNPEEITEHKSTSRLGWIEDMDQDGNKVKVFLPYDQEVIYDNELNSKSLFDSITQVGNRDKWYEHVKKIRARNQPEVLLNLAASFASVLIEPCGALPFIVCLWGGSGVGKTVILKLATSVWADPGEGKYITDAKATTTAMEIRLNLLNSLPMTLDDMAQVKNQYDEDFSELIYRWCAGKGKDRSNTNLGLNKLTNWRNCTITNGERSLVDETTQGGAVNRVIDIEASGTLFNAKQGNETINLVERNFGFGGRDFINVINEIKADEINRIMSSYYDLIKKTAEEQGVEKEDKQIVPMALILTADELIEKYLFKDGVRLDVGHCCTYLKNKGEVSEHKRAYEYLQGIVASNAFRFNDDPDDKDMANVEKWGCWKDSNKLLIVGPVFDRILKQGGFQSRAFLSWAKKNMIIETDKSGNAKVQSKFNGTNIRCVIINMNADGDPESEESDGFMPISEDLPFM